MAIPAPGNEVDHETERLRNICADLRAEADTAERHRLDWAREVQELENRIETEQFLLKDLEQQRRRTRDEGFDVDIAEKDRTIREVRLKLDQAREQVHKWEGQADIIGLQMEANNCDFFR